MVPSPIGDEQAIRALFLERYVRDCNDCTAGDLARYQQLFPGYESLVQRWFDEVSELANQRDEAMEMVGPYRLDEEIGRGGQGVVYRATDMRIARTVAIKFLNARPENPAALDRFRREAAATAKLSHPGIAVIFDVGEIDDRPFIAMRYVEGQSLTHWIDAHKANAKVASTSATETIREAVRIMQKVAEAVHAAHEGGVVHRDLKPANIMITTAGEPVVMDFGLAHTDGDERSPTLTIAGDLIGTPAYMSPEQLRSEVGIIGAHTDVWGLGVTLFECVTFRRPFEGVTREELYRRILHTETAAPQLLNPAVPKDLATVIMTALHKQPHLRYLSAAVLANDLTAVLEGRPVVARPVGPIARTIRWTRREPMKASLFTLISAALVFAMYFAVDARRTAAVLAASTAEELSRAFIEYRDLTDPADVARLHHALEWQDRGGQYAGLLARPATDITIDTVPSSATIRIRDAHSGEVIELGTTPTTLPLSEGSYIADLTLTDHSDCHYPFVVRRPAAQREHADRLKNYVVPMFETTAHGDEWVPIPAGWSLSGEPLAWRHSETFFIARNEVTFGEWIEFLDSRRADDANQGRDPMLEILVPRVASLGEPALLEQDESGSWQVAENIGVKIDSEQPVERVSRSAIDTFVGWKATQVPRRASWNYSLPTEDQWERAARGADGRAYPWGNAFVAELHGELLTPPSQSIDDREFGRRLPFDCSPWGVLHMAGSASEMTTSHYEVSLKAEMAKGGSVLSRRPRELSSGRRLYTANSAQTGVGLRLARITLPTAPEPTERVPFVEDFEGEYAGSMVFFVGTSWHEREAGHGEEWAIRDGQAYLRGGLDNESDSTGMLLPIELPPAFTITTEMTVVEQEKASPDGRTFALSLQPFIGPTAPQFVALSLWPGQVRLTSETDSIGEIVACDFDFGTCHVVELTVANGKASARVWPKGEKRPDSFDTQVALADSDPPRYCLWSTTTYIG
ncbi:MAG: serine/threonine protein kinase/formylglycine-generating enzyme required for sulfatase activity, partial [Hyphomicrobiaceae bacterium]